jgi:hypothetical protein
MMSLAFRRAGRAALAFAVALAGATALTTPAWADPGRVHTVQANPELQKRADALFKALTESGGKVKFGAIEPGSKPDAMVIKDIEITTPDGKTFKIERIEVRNYDWTNAEQPMFVDVSMAKLVIPAEALDKEAGDLGITSLTINADFVYAFDDAKKSFEITNIALDVVELAELSIKLKLAGISMADIKRMTGEGEKKEGDDAMKLLANVNIVSAAITFKDKSLTERLIRAEAKKKQMTEAAAKAKLLEDLAEQRKKAEDDATREVLDHAAKFLRNPGQIDVLANPSQPANVMMAFAMVMSNPANLKQLLGLSITVK